MPKQRLVDFRGGQNNKISPHMIGDTQGQSAVNVDLSAVRLQGRNALDGDAAAGTFYYEVTGGGSWVSTDSQDASHIDHAVDFAIWNQDLYVAMGATSSNGILQVYRDGNLSSPQLLSFNPPGASSSVTPSYATNTLLVEETEEQEYIPITYQKTPVTTYNAAGPWDSEGYTFSPAGRNHFDTGAKITYYEWKRGASPGYWSESNSIDSNEESAEPIFTRSGTAGIPESTGVEATTVVTNGYAPNGETVDIEGVTYYVWAKTGSADLVAVQNTSTPEVNLYNFSTTTISIPTSVDEERASATDQWADRLDNLYPWSGADGLVRREIRYMQGDGTAFSTVWDASTQTTSDLPADPYVGPDGLNVSKVEWSWHHQSHSSLIGWEKLDQQYDRENGEWFWLEHHLNGIVHYSIYGLNGYFGSTVGVTDDSVEDLTVLQLKMLASHYTGDRGEYQVFRGDYVETISSAAGIYKYYKIPRYTEWTYKIKVSGTYSAPSTAYSLGNKATFTKQAVPDNYTYTQFEDNLRVDGQPFISATPEFYRDQARYYLYRESTAEDLVASESDWEIDPARESSSGGWLGDGAAKRTITGDIEGYYAKTARNQNNIPVLSQEMTRLAPTSSFDTDLVFSPRRLNFSFQTPSDNSTAGVPALIGYYLSRIDSISTVALGYVNPDRTVTLTHQTPNKLQLTGLGSGTYRIKFYCYQGAQLAVGTSSFDKFNLDGVDVGNNQYLTIASGSQVPESWAVDIWIEKRALVSTSGLETWATVQCFEVFAFDGDVSVNKCDFLDIFPNGISSGALAFAEEQQSPPEYLKFIRQSNNFFFAVGTTKTPEIRYGYNSNKADSYLFVSRFNNPRDWPLDGYVEFEDSITGLFAYSGELIVWTQHGTYRVFGSSHNQMRKVKLATTEGMVSGDHKSAALVRGYLVWMSSSGICVYDGSSVTNITEGRFETFTKLGGAHAGQIDGVYYLCNSQEQGYSVDFNLPGFPITKVNLKEDKSGTVTNPVLVYRSATNRLYSRRGQVAANASRTVWAYKTRAFDGGEFGRNKLVHSIELNGSNQSTGAVQVLLDGVSVHTSTVTLPGYPITIYLPPNSIGDVWSVSLTNWTGVVDYISTEYQVL